MLPRPGREDGHAVKREKKKQRNDTKPRELTPAYLTACPHPEKFGYRTKGAAKRDLRRRRGMTKRDDLHAYRCRCGLFHIGHKRGTKATLTVTDERGTS